MRKKIVLYGVAAGLTLSALTGCSNTANAVQETEAVVTEGPVAETENTVEVKTEPETETEEATEVTEETGEGLLAQMEPLLVWGRVTKVSEENKQIVIDNKSGNSADGEMVLNISEETKTLDAVEALPVDWTEISEGDFIYTYIGPAMTMSLPPMTNAEVIICKIPADYKVPTLVKVDAMEMQDDRSYVLTAVGEAEYAVPEDCLIQPYLTATAISLEDVGEGDTCLVWTDADNNISKIVLFTE